MHLLRFEELGDVEDIDKAITFGEEAVRFSPAGHSRKLVMLSNLSQSYMRLFQSRGQLDNLNKSIAYAEKAMRLTPDGHLDKPIHLNALGHSYAALYAITDRLEDLEISISRLEQAVELTPDVHPDMPTYLGDLSSSYDRLYMRLGKLGDLNRSIIYKEKAVDLTPNSHPDKPGHLNSLGYSYLFLYERLGKPGDLDKSISHQEQAVELTPGGYPNISARLSILGSSYLELYLRLGRLGDLDRSISREEQAVDITPDGHPDKPKYFNYLGRSYLYLHHHLGRASDIDRSISWLKQAVDLTPDYSADKPGYLHTLGHCFQNLFQHRGMLSDIEQSIAAFEHAVNLTSDDHPYRAVILQGLACGYAKAFCHLRHLEHSDKAMYYFGLALSLLPDDSPYTPNFLSNLGGLCGQRFILFGNMQDADQAFIYLTEAERLYSDHHPEDTRHLMNLGGLHTELFLRTKRRSYGHSAMTWFRAAAHTVAERPSCRLQASRKWAYLAYYFCSAPLEAYAYCMMLLPQVVWLGTSVTYQHACVARDVRNLIATAASVAISLEKSDIALEWLEQGRSIVWSQLLQLRTPLDELSNHCPELTDKLKRISSELESRSMLSLDEQSPVGVGGLLRDTSVRYRHLAEQREALLQSVRALPGLEHFLLPPKAHRLVNLVKEGVAVVVNIHIGRCDALIIRAGVEAISCVPLLNFATQKAESACTELAAYLAFQGSRRGVKNGERNPNFRHALSVLWYDVVKPVLDHIDITYQPLREDLPRITWCTTGALSFLPLHAAGDYADPSTVLPNLAISSYTPTISMLGQHTSSPDTTFSGILAVSHVSSVRGLSPLPGTKAEIDQIAEQAEHIGLTRLDEECCTADNVLQAMRSHSWVHFACHGSQNPDEPMKSALHLHDRDLDLATIAQNPLENAQFASLSACSTATGDKALPDESIHLAAGLLMAGYPTVIATMWSISDQDAHLVAGKVYECLLENGVPDSRKAAKALHRAVTSLRDSIGVDQFARWVPYIHIGR
ncbi:hypothetical protein FRC12_002482 [Ceratobasidium sp. 428]|nr:hypothetical protein FRC12_002482 [Ceratobasidium sp. 428]